MCPFKTKFVGILFFALSGQVLMAQETWLKVDCGTEFCLALKSDRTLWAWGSNLNGQLGIGSTVTQVIPT
ncbi:MAG: hypothetical protein ACK5CY_02900, partial [Bacteroidia bacterium]